HAQGVAGAPKLDDQAAWEPRVAKGMETLVSHAINGFNAMPPKGGNMSLSDEEVSHAVAYMVAQSGAATASETPAAAAAETTAAPGAVAEAETRTEPLTAPAVNDPAIGEERITITPSQGSQPPAQEPPAGDGGVEMIIPEETSQQAPEPSPQQTEAAAAALQAGEAADQEPAAGQAPAAGASPQQPEGPAQPPAPSVDQEAQGRVQAPAPLPRLTEEQGEALEQAVEEPPAAESQAEIQEQVGVPTPAPALQSDKLIPGSETAPQGMVKGVPATQEPQAPELMAPQASVPEDVDLARGKQLYNTACVICHGQGVAGAPVFADQSAWAPRLGQGFDTLVDHAINGYKAMPPKGGRMDVPDEDIRAAVGYMVDGVR
ncbi:MAG: c-type cytochrome, partial [Candidatus Competibacteraceae bacterium]|nr:c-type cytochrome [Candidatus Competibacteraceae bacterium]